MAWGAQAYVFPNASARALLRSSLAINHRNRGPLGGLCNIDTIVGQWCDLAGLPYLIHSPSPTQHIGGTSAIWERGDTVGRRRAATFPGESESLCRIMELKEPDFTTKRDPTPGNPWDGSLAICAPLVGRRESFDPWRQWLISAKFPASTRLYILDNSGDPEFSELVKTAAEEFAGSDQFERVHLHIRRQPPVVPSRNTIERQWAVADAYNAALLHSEGDEDFVFLLDDDTIPPLGCMSDLYAAHSDLTARGENPGAVSGCYESASNSGFLVANYSTVDWSRIIPVGTLKASEIVKVGTVGSGCMLVTGSLFWDCFPIRGESIVGIVGPDSYLCAEIRRKGGTVWLHGGVVCDHLSAKKPLRGERLVDSAVLVEGAD